MIPGSNILGLAMSVIGAQPVTWQKFLSRTTNAAGKQVPSYAPAEPLQGSSCQAVPRTRYASLGLDFSRDYVMLYTPADVIGVARDGSGDLITYNGRVFQCESETDWFGQDGWKAILAVRVP